MRSTVRTFCASLMGRRSDRIATLSSSRATVTETLCSRMTVFTHGATYTPGPGTDQISSQPQRGMTCALRCSRSEVRKSVET